MEKKSPVRVFFKELFGILFFLILLGVVNLISNNVNNYYFTSIVNFFNSNVLFLIAISIVMLLGALFAAFAFPLNLPHPIFHAIGGVMIVDFIFMMFNLIDSLGENFFGAFEGFYVPAVVLVFVLVLVVGYVKIFYELLSFGKGKEKDLDERIGKKVKEVFEKMRGEVVVEKKRGKRKN